MPPSKAPRLFQVRNVLEHEDEVVSFEFENEETELLEEYEYELQENVEVLADAEKEVLSSSKVEAALDQLCVPYTPLEPELDEPSLLAWDALAGKVEMARLKGLGVLLPLFEFDTSVTPKALTTRFVRAWRDKKRNGVHVWLRRSRYVAREYAWLTPEREDLISPASSSLTTRLLPIVFLKLRLQGFVLAAIDVANAFLTVEQKIPTVVTCSTPAGTSEQFVLGKVPSGQRDGRQLWYESITAILDREDILCFVHEKFLSDKLMPVFEGHYKVAIEVMRNVGDELCFLKKNHILQSETEILIQNHPKHLNRLFELLQVKPKNVLGHAMLEEADESAALDAASAKSSRSAVGIFLYISVDFVECQHVIRLLAQHMNKPSELNMLFLRHLVQCLLGCVDQGIQLPFKPHEGVFHHTGSELVLEVYSDSDWASHKGTKKSVVHQLCFSMVA